MSGPPDRHPSGHLILGHPPLCYPNPMVTLELQPEVESQLTAEAQSLGLSPSQYVEQLILSRFSDYDEALQEGLDDIAAGRTVSAREAFAQLREEFDIRG